MDAKRDLLLQGKNTNYKCMKCKVPKEIFGRKKVEVSEQFGIFHKQKLRDLYISSSTVQSVKSSRPRWVVHVAGMVETRNAYRIWVRKPAGKRPLGRE
jgi:hypothetical protein